MVEIYGLYDPDTDELRYIGKANDSAKRLRSHISDSKREKRPICLWIAGLLAEGKIPVIKVLERVSPDEWKAAEKRLIAHYKGIASLLNLAPGGDMPSMTPEQRSANGKKMNAKIAANPLWLNYVRAKRDMAKLYAQFCKKPDINTYVLRLHMKMDAARSPHLCGEWALL